MLAVILKWYQILLHESSVTFECVRMLLTKTIPITSWLSIVHTTKKTKYGISNINSGLHKLKETIIFKYALVCTVFSLKEICKQTQDSPQQRMLSQVLCWNENIPFQNRIPSGVEKLLSLLSQGIRDLLP